MTIRCHQHLVLHNFVHPFGHTQAFLNPAFDDVATDLNIQITVNPAF